MDITLGGKQFVTTGKLSVFDQLHLARKLGPALPILEGLVAPENAGKDKKVLTVLMMSQLPDSDSAFVLHKCLSVVAVRQADGTRAKLTAGDGSLMFDDVEMSTVLDLTVVVIEENLGDFFRTALSSSAQALASQT